jgi:glutamate-1-semialdehyde 2,1-aminomutase
MTTLQEDQSTQRFIEQRTRARALFQRANQVVAGGVGHDMRYNAVAPTYITHARGAHKWDVDGNEYVDYGMGNAALLLGHAHPEVIEAVQRAVPNGLHFGNDHPEMLDWAELIQKLIPSAERVRFTNSGSEGAMLALRLARAFSGREKVLRLEGHFSGWSDAVGKGASPPFDSAVSLGIPASTLETIVVVPADLATIEQTLVAQADIGALMLEPSGGSWGTVPLTHDFNRQLRELTRKHDVLLIYDEVITGFRYSAGGYQQLVGVKPDLTVLGKVVTGGLPGSAVAGRADIMELFSYTGEARHDRYQRVTHQGTFNANPLTVAAGIATLRLVADGSPQAVADRLAERLRAGMNQVLERRGVAGYVYGDSSVWHFYVQAQPGSGARTREQVQTLDATTLKSIPGNLVTAFQRNLQVRGVDNLSYTGGVCSAAHTEADIDQTVATFDQTIQALVDERMVATLS